MPTEILHNKKNGSTTDKVTAKISYHESTAPYYGGIFETAGKYLPMTVCAQRATTINANTAEVTQIKITARCRQNCL
jgi:hypothetical protein